MDDAAWTRLREAAQKLEAASRTMADADVIRAGGPNLVDGKVPEGAASRAEIQAMIDADPAGFRAEAPRSRRTGQAAGRRGAGAGRRGGRATGRRKSTNPANRATRRYWYKQDIAAAGRAPPSA
jgi:hypothetical protein